MVGMALGYSIRRIGLCRLLDMASLPVDSLEFPPSH